MGKGKNADQGLPCDKCGSHLGWKGPLYVPGRDETISNYSDPSFVDVTTVHVAEHLLYVCVHCGYTRKQHIQRTTP